MYALLCVVFSQVPMPSHSCSVIGDWLSLWKSLLQLMVYLVNTQHKGLLNKMATEEVTSALWCFLSPLIKLFHTGEKGWLCHLDSCVLLFPPFVVVFTINHYQSSIIVNHHHLSSSIIIISSSIIMILSIIVHHHLQVLMMCWKLLVPSCPACINTPI